jgi:hypothetical protein
MNGFLQGAQNFAGNIGRTVQSGYNTAVNNLTSGQPLPYHPGGGGLVPKIMTAAQNFLNPQQAGAQTPPPQQPTQAFQRPTQTASIVPGAGQYQPPTANLTSYSGTGTPNFSPTEAASNYASAIAPYQQQIKDYLATRDPVSYYNSALDTTGANKLQGLLSGYEGTIADLQDQLQHGPETDIARRADNSTLSAAQRYRLKAAEQEPILKNLATVQQGYNTTSAGYDRATSLAQQLANQYSNQTSQGAGLLQGNVNNIGDLVKSAISYRGQSAQPSAVAQNQAVQQAQEQGMRQITASVGQEVRNGATLQQMMAKYLALGLDADTILSLYNSNVQAKSAGGYGPATESGETLTSRYGVSPGRIPALTQ